MKYVESKAQMYDFKLGLICAKKMGAEQKF
jgi:hypothetical protein